MITSVDDLEVIPDRDRDERADHEHLAVGEVDQLDDPVDQRVAEGDERPDRAVGEAGLDVPEGLGRGLDEVVQDPRAQPDPEDVLPQRRRDPAAHRWLGLG
jgi:hypothetical protein